MLEIIALIFLTRSIGNLAERKGLKKGWWKFYAVIAWFGAEFLGAVVGILILRTEDVLPVLPFAWAFAIGSYFVLKAYLSRKPDVVDPAFEFEGPHQHPQ